jgi:release factor glutamine methyltransferase
MSSPPGQKPIAWQPLESNHVNGYQETIGSVLHDAFQKLKSASDTPLADSQVVLGFFLQKPRAWIIAHPEQPLTPEVQLHFSRAVNRLASGEPLAYVLGRQEFFGLEYIVAPGVLVPRPETELLVEVGLEWLQARPARRRAVDVGTGSGCIAISLANRVPDLSVVASDLSMAALHVARQNIHKHRLVERVLPLQADLLPPVSQQFDLVCANLPYIPSHTLHGLPVSRHEPVLALDGGLDGDLLIERLLKTARASLQPGACLLLEINNEQGSLVCGKARGYFPEAQVTLLQDYAGKDRLVVVQQPENGDLRNYG